MSERRAMRCEDWWGGALTEKGFVYFVHALSVAKLCGVKGAEHSVLIRMADIWCSRVDANKLPRTTYAHLAACADMSERQVKRIVGDMERRGIIAKSPVATGFTFDLRPLIARLEASDMSMIWRGEPAVGGDVHVTPPAGGDVHDTQGVTYMSPGGDVHVTRG